LALFFAKEVLTPPAKEIGEYLRRLVRTKLKKKHKKKTRLEKKPTKRR
jgi:hypothetical protein